MIGEARETAVLSPPACPTPHCQGLARRGKPPEYCDVRGIPHVRDATHRCECCGGLWTGREWVHRCAKCSVTVSPGELRGMFVPHLCTACNQRIVDAERAAGRICSTCQNVRSYCYC